MSTTATPTPTATPSHSSSSTESAAGHRRSPRVRPRGVPAPTVRAVARGGMQPFEVPFASPMSDSDLGLLARTLDLSPLMDPKMRPSPNSPGVARLDHFSGLFLTRGADEGHWIFEARTWGHPAMQIVHGWQLLAADAAHLLDPTVIRPERLIASSPETPTHAPGRAANRRLARIRRRLVGLR